MIGHLIEIPLTNGRAAMLDPMEVAEVSSQDDRTTLVRCRDQRFVHYVRASYGEVQEWLAAGFSVCRRKVDQ